jgi:hypothetical protein
MISQEKLKKRHAIYNYFVKTALEENRKNEQLDFRDLFDFNDKTRILFVIKESVGDCFIVTSLFKNLKEQYPNSDLYVCTDPKYFDIFAGNPYVYKLVPYLQVVENELIMTQGSKPIANVYIHTAIATQRILNYISKDKIGFELK